MTLVELLVALTILSIIMVGITDGFVSSIRAETDLNNRFQAQEMVRSSLSSFRSDLHCASAVTPTTGTVSSITLTIPAGCHTSAGSLTWCTVGGTSGYDLWRIPGASCTTSTAGAVRWTRGLSAQNVFTPDASTHAGSPVLPSVAVSLKVVKGGRSYSAGDSIYLRNGTRQ